MKKAEGLAMTLGLQNTATIILFITKQVLFKFTLRKVIPAPSGTVKVGFPRKNPRTNKLDSTMLKSKNQVTSFVNYS